MRKHHEEKAEDCIHGDNPQGELPLDIDVKGERKKIFMEMKR
jgi:hypothetical protein